jgi:hypothetical protein
MTVFAKAYRALRTVRQMVARLKKDLSWGTDGSISHSTELVNKQSGPTGRSNGTNPHKQVVSQEVPGSGGAKAGCRHWQGNGGARHSLLTKSLATEVMPALCRVRN